MNIGDTFTTGPKEAAYVVNKLNKPKSVIASHANEQATRNGRPLAGTRTEQFLQAVTVPAQPAAGARRSDPGNNALVGPAIRTDPTLARLLAQPRRLGRGTAGRLATAQRVAGRRHPMADAAAHPGWPAGELRLRGSCNAAGADRCPARSGGRRAPYSGEFL